MLLLLAVLKCGVAGGGGQALMLLMLLLVLQDVVVNGLRNDGDLNPLTGYNGYYRPATRTQSRCSLLYQMPEN